jgi:hypothetical protein
MLATPGRNENPTSRRNRHRTLKKGPAVDSAEAVGKSTPDSVFCTESVRLNRTMSICPPRALPVPVPCPLLLIPRPPEQDPQRQKRRQ